MNKLQYIIITELIWAWEVAIMNQVSNEKAVASKKMNCWQLMHCDRGPGGAKAATLGVCPAAVDQSFDGINSGICGGRICWAVAGTFCGGAAQGTFIDKRRSCLDCDFYHIVQREEKLDSHKTKFLNFIASDDRSPLFDRMSFQHIPAGTRFVTQGAVETKAYIIQKGSCLVIVEKNGELYPVDHYGEGDIVGGLGILTGEPRRAHVEAETGMNLWVLTKESFDDFAQKDPALLDFITELVADRLDSRRPIAYRTIGKYVFTDIIGRGAFSLVYKGFHQFLKTPVVIKMMRHNLALYPDFIDSFHYEAKTIAGLSHDHIVKVFDFDERYQTLFIIMEFINGHLLSDMISHLKSVPYRLAIYLLYQICDALAYAHRQGIIHRDINPTNIIVQPNHQLKILDFGLACPAGTEDYSSLGTAHYMAPEQVTGEPLDSRTDIYAVGITAFEMVTGRLPFQATDTKYLLRLHQTQDIPDPKMYAPDIPEELRQFILKAAKCNPDDRFQTVEEAMRMVDSMVRNIDFQNNNLLTIQQHNLTLVLDYDNKIHDRLLKITDKFMKEVQSLGATVEILDS